MSGQAATAGPGPPVRLLVADGDPSLRRVLHLALQARGYQVTLADTANAALQLAGHQHPELIILDLWAKADREPGDGRWFLLYQGQAALKEAGHLGLLARLDDQANQQPHRNHRRFPFEGIAATTSTTHNRRSYCGGLTHSGMEMVRDGEAASSTQRTITARDVDRRCNSTSWLPPWWRLCLLTVLEITWTYGYLGRAGPSSAHEMMPSLV